MAITPDIPQRLMTLIERFDDDDNLSNTDDDAEIIHHLRSKRKITKSENKAKNKRTRQPSYSLDDQTSLHGGSDLDAEIDKVIHDCPDRDDISDKGDNEFIKNIASDLSATKKSGEPIKNSLAKVINNVIYNAISDEKLTEKFDKDKAPENLKALHIKKCNYDIWTEKVPSKTRSKGVF